MLDTSVRKTKRADELEPGDRALDLASPTTASKVLTAYPYSDGDDRVLVVYEDPDALPATLHLMAGTVLGLATDEELAKQREVTDRARFVAGLREFADWVEMNPWAPVMRPSGYVQTARLQIDLHGADMDATAATVDEVRQIAEQLGVKVDEMADRTDASVTIGSVSYSVIAWHKDGRPAEPKPLVDPDASMEAHYDAEIDARTPHPSWPSKAELKPWETLAPAAEALAESMVPIADPTGLGYSREADDPTPVSPARVPLHTGAMVDGGQLVDETGGE